LEGAEEYFPLFPFVSEGRMPDEAPGSRRQMHAAAERQINDRMPVEDGTGKAAIAFHKANPNHSQSEPAPHFKLDCKHYLGLVRGK
jgi:hypothetical protein